MLKSEQKQQLNILLLSDIPVHVDDYKEVIEEQGHYLVVCDVDEKIVIEMVKNIAPDVLVLDVAKPTNSLFAKLKALMFDCPCPVVMFTGNDDRDSIEKAIESGVAAYVVKGWYPKRIMAVIDTAVIRFNKMQEMQKELYDSRRQIEERKLIEKAKGIVMKKSSLDEETAYKSLRKMAMDKNMKLVDLARSVITASDLLV